MRPHHLVLVCLFVVGFPTVLTFFSLLHSHPSGEIATEATSGASGSSLKALFSFHTPSTLFPPSAIISLTDDNSTFFLSRPADFGPALSANGISGQLWVGSGFGDDTIGRGGAGDGAEGELGCSDIPDWDEKPQPVRRDEVLKDDKESDKADPGKPSDSEEPTADDWTDDHLHYPLQSSPLIKSVAEHASMQHPPHEVDQTSTHADIQSLQESAEISGKVVLLSRGGCGFLEKVKWAQRRGASALIVGDHTRGAPLITMYARGDTSNVTISSLFTSHTTAHLLSSLIPVDENIEGSDSTEAKAKLGAAKDNKVAAINDDRPTFTSVANPKSTTALRNDPRNQLGRAKGTHQGAKRELKKKTGWLTSLFGRSGKTGGGEDSRRPPSSGRLHGLSEKWTDESFKDRPTKSDRKGQLQATANKKVDSVVGDSHKASLHAPVNDDFVIGVQDWRDPDLAAQPSSKLKSTTTTVSLPPTPLSTNVLLRGGQSEDERLATALRGGSITPGSGRYQKPKSEPESQSISQKADFDQPHRQSISSPEHAPATSYSHEGDNDYHTNEEHEGLWVTLTPTTMSTSPFFDTLLVLVVSPLITLTVVYAMLLVRSRIRRQRWRAPKSVVDRLPVRTYHTMSCASSTTSSSRVATPHSSSPTSPLLRPIPRTVSSRSRPRSATATGVSSTHSASVDSISEVPPAKGSSEQQEKQAVPRKSRKRYHAKQVECVVCLDEYVDGESRVMSLPCGHEFHAECM